MPNAFNDSRHIIKSHILANNASTRVEIPIHKSIPEDWLVIQITPKCGRPVGAKNVVPKKRNYNL